MTRGRARARSAEDQDRVRKRFVDCARMVFAREGIQGLTMRRLAAEAGYSAGTIYLYFTNRNDLLREVWKEGLQSLRVELASRASDQTGFERLHALLHGYGDFWFEHPDHFKALFLGLDRQYNTERAAFSEDESVQTVHAFLLDETVSAMSETGMNEDRTEDGIRALCHSLIASVHGVVALHIGMPGFPWSAREVMMSTVVSTLLAGLRAENAG